MSGLVERLRWRLVGLLNLLSGQCWADLAAWAGRWDGDDEVYGLPWRPQGWACRVDANEFGWCHCGKLQAEPWAAPVHEAHASAGRWDGETAAYHVLCVCGWHGRDYRAHVRAALDDARPVTS